MHRLFRVDYFELDWCADGSELSVLCADRVGQMTKTYNDIDAVTRLLEEKERDLELAARIGQSLLKKNRRLTEQNDYLEEQVLAIREEVAQLHHELNLKDELLQFYTNAAEESEEDSGSPTGRGRLGLSAPSGSALDVMQKKLTELEEENLSLKTEAYHLKTETETYEEKEQQLVQDCVKELKQSSLQISTIAEELAKKTEDASRQQEEITYLLSQIVDLQKKAKMFAVENEELSQHLNAAKDAQRQLTSELQDLEEKYIECIEMLHEAQEELKNLRNRSMSGTPRRYHPLGLFPMDSLAAEIEGSMRKEMSQDDPECQEQKVHQRRVFETVKNINQTVRQRSPAPPFSNIPGSNQMLSPLSSAFSSGMATPQSNLSETKLSGSNLALDNRTQSLLQEGESTPGSGMDTPKKRTSSEDLKLALRRLSLRRQNCLSERRFFEEERESGLYPHDGPHYVSGLVHSDSIMSLGSHLSWASRPYLPDKLQIVKPLEGSITLQQWQQLAQPNLGGILDARPGVVTKGFRPLNLDLEEVCHYSDFEEDEPGEQYFQNLPTTSTPNPNPNPVQTHVISTASPSPCLSTGQALNTDFSVYYPGKCMAHTSSTYTFTTCRILHPSDELTRVTPSLNPGPTSSCGPSSSLRSTPAVTPCTPRRMSLAQSQSFTNLRDSTKTFSTSLGLVRLLQERGISAAVYQHQSWDRSSVAPGGGGGGGGVLFSTTVAPRTSTYPQRPSTPPNSPVHGTQSPSSLAEQDDDFSFKSPSNENFLASRPARSILMEVAAAGGGGGGGGGGGAAQQARDCESQTDVSVYNLNLVDKLKRLGLASPGRGQPRGHAPILGALGGLRRPGSPFSLNEGMRRNRSYPVMVGASMAMKGPGPQDDEEMLLEPKLPKQTSLK
ncbi:trafficking kinesin-binding protein 1 isoform X1 [Alosa sapidissima]|uniref:trafficking kinesin-binding protein 1 isoform X1 n=2 Tax=Alosa sapidissima TaxID=34773 RepID=UPI001C092C86|nr:trafficking kinesin-binding protein 1 isoform X1 [Alosa sapidissima]